MQDYKLPGPQGFDALLEGIRLREPEISDAGIANGEVYVDARTKRLCIGIYRSLGAEMGYEKELHELGPWVAYRILVLSDQAARNRGK